MAQHHHDWQGLALTLYGEWRPFVGGGSCRMYSVMHCECGAFAIEQVDRRFVGKFPENVKHWMDRHEWIKRHYPSSKLDEFFFPGE